MLASRRDKRQAQQNYTQKHNGCDTSPAVQSVDTVRAPGHRNSQAEEGHRSTKKLRKRRDVKYMSQECPRRVQRG